MKKSFYHNVDISRRFNKFNTIFESIISGVNAFDDVKEDPTLFVRRSDVNLLLEEIEKPQYVISESTGNVILLEECLFWDEKHLIAEDVADKAIDKIEELFSKIKKAIVNILSEASSAIKAFCNRIIKNSIVKIIIQRYKLDEKINVNRFKKLLKYKKSKGEAYEESLNIHSNNNVVTEARLSEKEQNMSSAEEIQSQIKLYEEVLAGRKIMINKSTGKPRSEEFVKDKIRLLTEKLKSLNNSKSSLRKGITFRKKYF